MHSNLHAKRGSILYRHYIILLWINWMLPLKNDELAKQLEKKGAEITKLKLEVADILKNKKESQAALTEAKKLIADQAALLEKLEAEVKRLSQPKKTNQ